MYSFSEEQSQSIRDKANNLLGQTFKYKQLCIALGIEPVKNSNTNTKNKQLRDLQTLIELREIPHGKQKAYLIVSVHEHSESAYYDRDEWYSAFKSVIFSEVRMEQWFTRTTLFYKLGIVNDNYKVVLHDNERRLLSKHHDRNFDNERRVCRIVGSILRDRVYDSLDRMAVDGLIGCGKGYVIQYSDKVDEDSQDDKCKYEFYPVRPDDDDSVYQLIQSMDKEIIDEIRAKEEGELVFGCHSLLQEVSDAQIKSRYYNEYVKMREEIDTTELSKLLEQRGISDISIKGVFDAVFIFPLWERDDVVIRPDAKRILNDWAKKTVLNSNDKRFDGYRELKKGCVDVYIDLNTTVDYVAVTKV